jgi:hypothetical protein
MGKKTSTERAREAEQKAARWLHFGNLASERGDLEKAERHYERSQKWHDLMNIYLGNGDGSESGDDRDMLPCDYEDDRDARRPVRKG